MVQRPTNIPMVTISSCCQQRGHPEHDCFGDIQAKPQHGYRPDHRLARQTGTDEKRRQHHGRSKRAARDNSVGDPSESQTPEPDLDLFLLEASDSEGLRPTKTDPKTNATTPTGRDT